MNSSKADAERVEALVSNTWRSWIGAEVSVSIRVRLAWLIRRVALDIRGTREQITYLSTSSDLTHKVFSTDSSNLIQNSFGILRISINPTLNFLPRLTSTTFYHIPKQRPRSRTKSNQGHSSFQSISRQSNSREDIIQFIKHFRFSFQYSLDCIFRSCERIREMRSHPT